LTELECSNNNITDISPIASLTNLTRLNLLKNPINDISPLTNLKNLTYLNLSRGKLTKEQNNALQAALPNCKINGY